MNKHSDGEEHPAEGLVHRRTIDLGDLGPDLAMHAKGAEQQYNFVELSAYLSFSIIRYGFCNSICVCVFVNQGFFMTSPNLAIEVLGLFT